jgi:exosome complex component RRP42
MKDPIGYKVTRKQIIDYLKEGKRIDGRKPFDYRDVEVKTNISINAEGSVSVKIGKTEVACGIKMATQEPYTDHEGEGTMMVSMDLLPLSSPDFEYGPPRIGAIEPARIVDRGIRESGFIDFSKLCIEEGKKVWNIFIDIVTINDDGNLIDASALAAVLALRLAKMPVYDEKTEKVKYGEFTKQGLPLTDNMPLTTTFYKIEEGIFVDPSREEVLASDGRLTVEISQSEKAKEPMINAMQKGGKTVFSVDEIEMVLKEAGKIFKNLKDIVELEVKKADKK